MLFSLNMSTVRKLKSESIKNNELDSYLLGRIARSVRSKKKRLIASKMCETSSSEWLSSLVNDCMYILLANMIADVSFTKFL